MDFLISISLILAVLLGATLVLLGVAGWLEGWVMRDIRQKLDDNDAEDDE